MDGSPPYTASSPLPSSASPSTPSSPSEVESKRSNPLAELLDTEKVYVDLLAGIIRKVAAAWSRTNLPPPDLDLMFRSIEGVYKANRALQSKLKDLGSKPSSPKVLGDLLMRWVDDLEAPYAVHCNNYRCGFDTWTPVQLNSKLPGILSSFSASNPPLQSASSTWTLDSLFLLPKARLKYYKKIYTRLLKATAPGKSDHRLLLGAVDTLDRLLKVHDERSSSNVAQERSTTSSPSGGADDKVVIDLRTESIFRDVQKHSKYSLPSEDPACDKPSQSDTADNRHTTPEAADNSSSRDRFIIHGTSLAELEARLSTQRTLDIFTMQPKIVRLQLAPQSLTFARELRFFGEVTIRFSPQATGIEVVHTHGRVYLLSDLFLICEKILPDDIPHGGDSDMWLCYPPLSGKVLRVFELPESNALKVVIMRKENLIIETESSEARDILFSHFKDCIEFAVSLPPISKQPVPPLPPLNHVSLSSPSTPLNMPPTSPSLREPAPGSPIREAGPSERPALPFDRHHPQGYKSMMSLRAELPVQPSSSRPLSDDPNYAGSRRLGPVPGQILSQTQSQQHFNANFQTFSLDPNFPQTYIPPAMQYPQHPSEPGRLRKSTSSRSLGSRGSAQPQSSFHGPVPPLPPHPHRSQPVLPRRISFGNANAPQSAPILPSLQLSSRTASMPEHSLSDPSPPNSPVDETQKIAGALKSRIFANMRCKVFLQQQHAQWKSLGPAKLVLYNQDHTNVKQLVVQAENREKSVLISTIVLTDGVERVGKTGVAIELSDGGSRTGVIYMIQLRNESSAGGLFDSLLHGSDRANSGK